MMSVSVPGESSTVPPIPQRPRPLENFVTASAKRLTTSGKVARKVKPAATDWQSDAWDMYDLVGELRFLTTTLAGRLSQARFFVGKNPKGPTDDVVPVESDDPAAKAFEAMTDRPAAFVQMIYRLAMNLSLPGEGYLVGTPLTSSDPGDDAGDGDWGATPAGMRITTAPAAPPGDGERDGIDNSGVRVEDLEWRALSAEEIEFEDGTNGAPGTVTISVDPDNPEKFPEDQVYAIRVWRPHPRKWYEPDSATRSNLPVLRELVALTMDISAKVDSRLAGAGLLVVAESIRQALARSYGDGEDQGDAATVADFDPLTDALMEAMTTPISDRSSAAAVVPLVLSVPDDAVEKIKHITFSTPLDTAAKDLRDESIRRLALGMDCPPELLLGMGSMNHWGAWLMQEDVVTTHIEPILALICDALTTEYLWPVLTDSGGLGLDEDDARDYVIWYSVEHLVARPNRASDAKDLHSAGVLSDESLRNASGFDETDAPESVQADPALALVLQMVGNAPSLAATPGISALLAEVRSAMEGTPGEPPAAGDTGGDGEAPDGEDTSVMPDPEESSGPEVLEEDL